MTAGPAFEKAMAGRINKPELIIAPVAKENTSTKPSCFFSVDILKTFYTRGQIIIIDSVKVQFNTTQLPSINIATLIIKDFL